MVEVIGDRDVGDQYIGRAKALLFMLENQVSLRKKMKGIFPIQTSETRLSGRVVVKCWVAAGMSGATIMVAPAGGRKETTILPYCFANRTVALGVIVSVMGVDQMTQALLDSLSLPLDTECEPDLVCETCLIPDTYPENYYCTKDIRYTVEVCGGKDKYLLFENIPSTDFSPFCPGEKVLVVLHIADETPATVLSNAKARPRSESLVFPRELFILQSATFSILPFLVGKRLHESLEINQ